MKYQVTHEDEHLFHIKHPDGSTFAIAKKAVGPQVVERIQSFAKGGEVEDESQALRDSFANDVGSVVNPVVDYLTPHGAGKGIMDSLGSLVGSQAHADTVAPTPTPAAVQQAMAVPDFKAPAAPPAAPAHAVPQPDQILVPGMGQPVFPQSAGSYGGLEGAIRDSGKQTQDAIKAHQELEAQTQADVEKNDATYDAEQKRLSERYESQKTDPNRYWHDKSTGQKVGAMLGLILGGIGSGLTHGPNQALEVMNKAMDADIDAQKNEQGKTRTMLELNMQKYKDKNAAITATRLHNSILLDDKLKAAAGQAQTAQSLATIQMIRAQNAQKGQALQAELAQRQLVNKVVRGDQVTPAAAEYLPDGVRKRAVTVVGANGQPKLALARTENLAKEYSEAEMHSQEMDKKIMGAIKFMTNTGPTVNKWGEAQGEADVIRGSILTAMGKLHDLNRLNDHEFTVYSGMVPDPGQWRSARGIAQLQQLRQLIREKRETAAANLLENYNPGEFSAQMGAPVRK